MDVPATLGGWAAFILATLSVMVIIIGTVIRLARMHIKSAVSTSTEFTVRKAVMDGLAPVNVRLDAMQVQLVTQDGELARIRVIEQKINNGLEARQERMEKKLDSIVEHFVWTGDERRDT